MTDDGFFAELKERYGAFIASLEEKGVPAPRVLVPLVLLLVVGSLAFLATGGMAEQRVEVTLSVRDQAAAPIAGATVELLADGKPVDTALADAAGAVVFKPLKKNVEGRVLVARVSAKGFAQQDVTVVPGPNAPVSLSPAAVAAAARLRVKVLSDDTRSPLDFVSVDLLFADGTSRSGFTDPAGSFEAEADPVPVRATVRVSERGFEPFTQDYAGAELASGEGVIIRLVPIQKSVNEKQNAKGTFLVGVTSNGVPVPTARVALVHAGTGSTLRSALSGADGVAAFEDLAIGSSVLVSVDKAGFVPFTSDAISFDADGQRTSISLAPRTAATADALVVTVSTRGTGTAPLPVDGALVTVYDRTTLKTLATATTGRSGEARVDLARGASVHVTAFKEGFVPRGADATAGRTLALLLDESTAANAVSLRVAVTQNDEPSAGADVVLYKADGLPFGIPALQSSLDGTAAFTVPRRLAGAPYGVYAVASRGLWSGRSDAVSVADETLLPVALAPAPAVLSLKFTDLATGNPVANARASLLRDGVAVGACVSTPSGACVFADAPSETGLSLRVEAAGYNRYASSTFYLAPGERAAHTHALYPASFNQLSANFLGFVDNRGQAVREVGAGETYTARFSVNVPANADASHVLVRIGSRPTAAEDVAWISGWTSDAASVLASASFSPAACGTDPALVDSGEAAKWVQFNLERGFVGSREFTLKVRVSPRAQPGERVDVAFRAFLQRGRVPALYPADEPLLSSLIQKTAAGTSLVLADYCNAAVQSASLPVSGQSLACDAAFDGTFCSRLVLEDENGVRATQGLEVSLGQLLRIHVSFLSDKQIESLSAQSDYFEFLSFAPTSQTTLADASFQEGTASVFRVSHAPGQRLDGVLTARAIKAGQYAGFSLAVSVRDAASPRLQGFATVTGAEVLRVAVRPTEVVAGLQSPVRVTVSNAIGRPVNNAVVTLFECEGAPLAGREQTRSEAEDGEYVFRVSPVSTGELGVRATHPDYRRFSQCLVDVAADAFIEAEPEALEPFVGSSVDSRDRKQLRINNLLSEGVRVTAGVICAGAPNNVLRVFPAAASVRGRGNALFTLTVAENVTARGECLVQFRGSVGNRFSGDVFVPVSVNVQGPEPLVIAPGVLPLPNPIVLRVDAGGTSDELTFSIADLPGNVISHEVRGVDVQDRVVISNLDARRKLISLKADVPEVVQYTQSYGGAYPYALGGLPPGQANYMNPYQMAGLQNDYYAWALAQSRAGVAVHAGFQFPPGSGYANVNGFVHYNQPYGQPVPIGIPMVPFPPAYPGVPSYATPAYNPPQNFHYGGIYDQTNYGGGRYRSPYDHRPLAFPLRGRLRLTTDAGGVVERNVIVMPSPEAWLALQQQPGLYPRPPLVNYGGMGLPLARTQIQVVVSVCSKPGEKLQWCLHARLDRVSLPGRSLYARNLLVRPVPPDQLQWLGVQLRDYHPDLRVDFNVQDDADGYFLSARFSPTDADKDRKRFEGRQAFFLLHDPADPTAQYLIDATFAFDDGTKSVLPVRGFTKEAELVDGRANLYVQVTQDGRPLPQAGVPVYFQFYHANGDVAWAAFRTSTTQEVASVDAAQSTRTYVVTTDASGVAHASVPVTRGTVTVLAGPAETNLPVAFTINADARELTVTNNPAGVAKAVADQLTAPAQQPQRERLERQSTEQARTADPGAIVVDDVALDRDALPASGEGVALSATVRVPDFTNLQATSGHSLRVTHVHGLALATVKDASGSHVRGTHALVSAAVPESGGGVTLSHVFSRDDLDRAFGPGSLHEAEFNFVPTGVSLSPGNYRLEFSLTPAQTDDLRLGRWVTVQENQFGAPAVRAQLAPQTTRRLFDALVDRTVSGDPQLVLRYTQYLASQALADAAPQAAVAVFAGLEARWGLNFLYRATAPVVVREGISSASAAFEGEKPILFRSSDLANPWKGLDVDTQSPFFSQDFVKAVQNSDQAIEGRPGTRAASAANADFIETLRAVYIAPVQNGQTVWSQGCFLAFSPTRSLHEYVRFHPDPNEPRIQIEPRDPRNTCGTAHPQFANLEVTLARVSDLKVQVTLRRTSP